MVGASVSASPYLFLFCWPFLWSGGFYVLGWGGWSCSALVLTIDHSPATPHSFPHFLTVPLIPGFCSKKEHGPIFLFVL